MHVRYAFLLLGLVVALPAWGQSAALRGFVVDAEAGLALPGATVLLAALDGDASYGAATDSDGLFVVARFPPGRYRLRVSYIGYAAHTDTLEVDAGRVQTYDVTLYPADTALGELVVEGDREARDDFQAGLRSIEAADIVRIPTPDGTGDLAAYLTTLPGVVTTGESGGQLFIRGGEPSQNLVLLDGIPLYQPFHLLGFYSAFPTDLVGRADLYAGGYGAEYGSALSSILDVASRNGNMRRVSASASASPFVSGVRVEFPVVRDRVSVLASGRVSLLEDGASRLVGRALPYRFADAFAKLHTRLVANSQLSITGLHASDRGTIREVSEAFPDPPEIRWQTNAVGGRYLFLPGAVPVRGEVVVALTRFDTETGPPDQALPDQASQIEKWSSRMDLTQYGRTGEIRGGLFAGTTRLSSDLGGRAPESANVLTDAGLYVQPRFRVGRDLTLTAGLRLHTFPSLNVTVLEPRAHAQWRRGIHEMSAAGGWYHQEVVGLTDRRDAAGVFTAWTPTPAGEVAGAIHAVGGYRVTPMPGLAVTVEGYAKWITGLSVAEWTAFPRFTTNLQPAEGQAQGLDVRVEARRGAFVGTLAYGLSSVTYEAQQAQLSIWYGDEALRYRPAHDRRHQVNAVLSGTVAGFDLSARWQFGSGLPFSRAFGFDRFLLLDGGVDVFDVPAEDRVIYERPFNARLPTYHRLDVSVARDVRLGPAVLTAHAGLINAYDRANLFYYDVFTLQRVDQLPLLPSFGLTLAYD